MAVVLPSGSALTARDRARAGIALFLGVAVSAIGYTVMAAVVPLVAEDLLHSPRWAGLPSALSTTGVAVGSSVLSVLMMRRTRRIALALGYLLASVAAAAAAVAVASGSFLFVVTALFVLGAGHSANRLSRYVAADVALPERRSSAIGWNVWAATIGSVTGPLMLEPIRRAAVAVGLPESTGPFATAAVTFAVAAVILVIVFPPGRLRHPATPPAGASSATLVARAPAACLRLAVVSLAVSQVVMVLIMTMTPVHIRHGGGGLSWVGVVMASHTFGMFALSPLAGVLSDRVGRVPMILIGSAALAASGVLAAVAVPSANTLPFALFLLGLGWSFSFVAASALLTESTPPERRTILQGRVDSLVWGAAATASLGSGVLLSLVGYSTLGIAGAVVALVPLLFLPGARSGS